MDFYKEMLLAILNCMEARLKANEIPWLQDKAREYFALPRFIGVVERLGLIRPVLTVQPFFLNQVENTLRVMLGYNFSGWLWEQFCHCPPKEVPTKSSKAFHALLYSEFGDPLVVAFFPEERERVRTESGVTGDRRKTTITGRLLISLGLILREDPPLPVGKLVEVFSENAPSILLPDHKITTQAAVTLLRFAQIERLKEQKKRTAEKNVRKSFEAFMAKKAKKKL